MVHEIDHDQRVWNDDQTTAENSKDKLEEAPNQAQEPEVVSVERIETLTELKVNTLAARRTIEEILERLD